MIEGAVLSVDEKDELPGVIFGLSSGPAAKLAACTSVRMSATNIHTDVRAKEINEWTRKFNILARR
jgi:hypothetical protein